MPTAPLIHTGDPAYASPVIRAPSPASSVGTAYGPDETTQSDSELNPDAFEQKWSSKLKLNGPRVEEETSLPACIQILPQNETEERLFFDTILRGLRARVQQIEEEENFQQMLRQGSRIGLEQPPSDDNIDSLMRSMVTMSTADAHPISDGPWKPAGFRNISNGSFNYEDTVVKGKQKA